MERPRTLTDIASEILQHWETPNYAAAPYLDALYDMDCVIATRQGVADGEYYSDSAKSVILYFLSNATTWRGEDARRIKAELKGLVS